MIFGGILSLILLLFLILLIPAVQTQIAYYFVNKINAQSEQQFEVDQILMKINGQVELKKVRIQDHHQNPLLYIASMSTSIKDLKAIMEGDFGLETLDLEGLELNLTKYKWEETHSLALLFERFKTNREDKKLLKIGVQSIAVSAGFFQYTDLTETISKTFMLQDISLLATALALNDDQIDLSLSSMDFGIPNSLLERGQFFGQLHYDPCLLEVNALALKSEHLDVGGKVILENDQASFSDFSSKVTITSELRGSFALQTLREDSDYFKNTSPLFFEWTSEGTLNALNFSTLTLSHPDLYYQGALTIQSLFVPEQLQFKTEFSKFSWKPKAFLIAEGKALKLPKSLNVLEQIDLNGTFGFGKKELKFDLAMETNLGDQIINGGVDRIIFNKSKRHSASYHFDFDFNQFRFGSLLKKPQALTLSGPLKVSGKGLTLENAKVNWEAEALVLELQDIPIERLSFQGSLQQQQLRSTLRSDSKVLKLKSDVLFDFTKPIPSYSLVANLEQFDLNVLNPNLGGGKALFSSVVLANFEGTSLNDIKGSLRLSSAMFENRDKTIAINPIAIRQSIEGNNTTLAIENTDCISGSIKGSFFSKELPLLFQNAIQKVYTFLPQVNTRPDQNFDFRFIIYSKILDVLYPDLNIDKNININGTVAAGEKRSIINVDSPLLTLGTSKFTNLHFQLDTKNPIFNTFVSVDAYKDKNNSIQNFNMISTTLKDTLYFRTELLGGLEQRDRYELNFFHTRDPQGNSHFGLQKSTVDFKGNLWELNPEDEKTGQIVYNPSISKIAVSKLLFRSGAQEIQFSGNTINANNRALNLSLKNVALEGFFPQRETLQVAGKANLELFYERSPERNQLVLQTNIDDLVVNKEQLGRLSFHSQGNTKLNSYNFDMGIRQGQTNSLEVDGSFLKLDTASLNSNLRFNNFDISFLSALGKTAINRIRGKVSGDTTLWGPLENLQHNGNLQLTNGGFAIPFLNTDYTTALANVRLYNQTFDFENTPLEDTEENTQANLKGQFSHTNFTDWDANLDITSPRIMILNKPQEENVLFFGKGYLDGSVGVSGPTNNLLISVEGTTEKGTSIKVPWAEDYGISESNFIEFIDKKRMNNPLTAQEENPSLKQINGLEMEFELDINNNAEIEIVIDQDSGSFLRGSGAGNMFMEINTNGKFNMWGDFITFNGIYNFKNLGVLDKKFEVKPGGTIVWEGNPLGAIMDIEAVYEVPGGANPALLLDNPNFNKKIPTEVIIRLQGNLLKPDNPIFEIDFPNTSGTVASEINYRLSSPQRSQLQAISLLSQGIFINEVSVSMQGITNNLYQKASDIFSELLGEENDKLKVGIDYLQGDKNAVLDIATEDRLGFTLSTQISDRILLNGKIGVPVGGVEQTLIVGNVQIDFILNEEGSLKAKVFNKENEFRYIGDELGYTQGVGISYDVDFDTFKEMISKITQTSAKSAKSEPTIAGNTANAVNIDFVNKN